MATPSTQRVREHRSKSYARGLRPIQFWLPDTRKKAFVDECARQSALVSQADAQDKDLEVFLDEALADILEEN